jgi:hypothetical protein
VLLKDIEGLEHGLLSTYPPLQKMASPARITNREEIPVNEYPDESSRSIPAAAAPIALGLLCAYLVVAYVGGLPPFRTEPTTACKADTLTEVDQVFIDPTGSNDNRDNWSSEAARFSASLPECSKTIFWVISDKTASEAQRGAPILIPAGDPNASGKLQREQAAAVASARKAIVDRILDISTRRGAKWSDIFGVFERVQAPETGHRNIIVLFSDGKQSTAGGLNLEDGHHCADAVGVERRLDGRHPRRDLARFDAIRWVLPDKSGIPGCNSRVELEQFWRGMIRAASGGSFPDEFQFDTNLKWEKRYESN